LGSNDRLHFFAKEMGKFSQSLQWQTQAELKQLIKSVLAEIGESQSDYEVALKEDLVKLADFLLAAFVLNRILIQKENDKEEFAKVSNLATILSSPSRISGRVLERMRRKAEELQVI
jgi:hypothetical protein